ncbi:hypothetical protein [Paeniglutamicibacter cryotolerans]|uniref:Uncharacterized protein n=1 Tax=Paeniglutamicibacter cryotolerans TaxID=670079 RepID=A0A839QX36_9MICC|nr:hypothetical protein [Paeniglutamicibacter cryotolerans]MBB2996551.1 hypothetical protein [Paeniglutamicibacter cryotolerans]
MCYQRLATADGHAIHGLSAVRVDGRWANLDSAAKPQGVIFRRPGAGAPAVCGRSCGGRDYPEVEALPVAEAVNAMRGAAEALRLRRPSMRGA